MDDGGREIALQDEVLELLYWLEGEGFREHTTLVGLARFLARTPEQLRPVARRLIERGDVMEVDAGGHRLTPIGRREAARRFAEEFAPMLRQGHGECNDPACDCHTNPAGAAECHATRAERGHDH